VRSQADRLRALAAELASGAAGAQAAGSVLHDHLQQLLVAAKIQLELVKRADADTIRDS